MDLKTHIQSERGNASSLALAMGIPASYLSQMAVGNRAISPDRAAEIELRTNGVVTVEEMLPQREWIRTEDRSWPHPGGRPLLDVAADAREAA